MIETPRLRLVPLTLEVAEAIVTGLRPADEDAWAPEYPTEASLVAASALVAAAQAGEDPDRWAPFQVVRRDAGRVIGGTGAYPTEDPAVLQVGYSIAASERGHGFAEEALRGVLEWTVRQPGVDRVVAETAVTNAEGLEVFEAAGMQRAGVHDDLVLFVA